MTCNGTTRAFNAPRSSILYDPCVSGFRITPAALPGSNLGQRQLHKRPARCAVSYFSTAWSPV